MKYKTEKDLEKDVIKQFKNNSYFVRKMNCDDPGFPDLFVADMGNTCLIEIKLPKQNCKLIDLFEKSQYPWFLEYTKHSNNNYYLLYYWKNLYRLFLTEDIVENIYSNIDDIPYTRDSTKAFLKIL